MYYLLCFLESLLAVNLLVVVHEFGHMMAGRIFGVHSERFCIGLGPRLLGFRYKGTDYCVSPVPLGGYVRLDSSHAHDEGAACMMCLSTWKKIIVFFSGPAANLLFALVLFWTVFFVLGFKDNLPVVGRVAPESPAAEAGLLPGDRIAAVNGSRIVSWTQAQAALERPVSGSPARVDVVRPMHVDDAGEVSRKEAPGQPFTLDLPGDGLSGAIPVEQSFRFRLGPVVSAKIAYEKLAELNRLLFHAVTGLLTNKVPTSELMGPVYLFHFSAQTAAQNQVYLVYLLATISTCLFFFNLLPIPILDGGQIVLAVLEKAMRRPLAPRSMTILIRVSIVWLILLMGLATFNDVVRLLG